MTVRPEGPLAAFPEGQVIEALARPVPPIPTEWMALVCLRARSGFAKLINTDDPVPPPPARSGNGLDSVPGGVALGARTAGVLSGASSASVILRREEDQLPRRGTGPALPDACSGWRPVSDASRPRTGPGALRARRPRAERRVCDPRYMRRPCGGAVHCALEPRSTRAHLRRAGRSSFSRRDALRS